MPRKPMQNVQINLRIRENLRRRLEQSAKKRGVSLNFEMTSRLQDTFDQEVSRSNEEIGEDLKNIWKRYSAAFHELNKQGDLVRATEALLKQIETGKPIEAAAAKAKGVIAMIDAEAAMAVRQMHTTGEGQ